MKLSIIVVTWNSKEWLSTCLNSLNKALRGIRSEIVVVDNASSDNTVLFTKKHFPAVRLYPQKKNHGFGEGNNIGIKKARGEYILLLNPDTKVSRTAITTMLSYLEQHKKVGTVGPEQFDGKNRMIFMASRLSPRGALEYLIEKLYALMMSKTRVLFPTPYATYFLNGGCVLCRKIALDEAGGFDHKLFLYGEEFDFFPRIRRAGWSVVFMRNARIYHYREKSVSKTGKKYHFAFWSFYRIFKIYINNLSQRTHKKNKRRA